MVLYFFMIIFCRYLKMTVEIRTGNEKGGGGGGVQQKSLAGFKPRMQLCSYVRISPCVSFVVMLHGQTKERSSCEIHVCAQISKYPHSAL